MSIAFKTFKWGVKPFLGHGLGSIWPLGIVYQSFARRLIPERESLVDINGYKMKIRIEQGKGIGGIAHKLIFDHEYEPFATSIVQKYISEGQTFIDIGANIGYYSLLAAKIVGENGRVISFEPDERNFQDLIHNIGLNTFNNISPYQKAVSLRTGMSRLYLSKDEPGAHSLEECRDTSESLLVYTVKLDEVTKDMPVVDFIKIDTEGHEMSVLKGAHETLLKTNAMMIECWEEGLIKAGSCTQYLLDTLREHGFTNIYIIDEFRKMLVYATECSIRAYSRKHKFSANLICTKGV